MRRAVALVAAVLWLGCSKAEDGEGVPDPTVKSTATVESTQDPTPQPSAAPTTKTDPMGTADPLGAVAIPNLRSCVAQCADSNKMRAVGPEKIDEDCRKVCRDSCLKHCSGQAEGRPLNFEDNCKKDCRKQLDRLSR